jgi:hypothetical protein
MVDTQRTRSVPPRVVQPHEQTVRLLVERVMAQQTLAVDDCLGKVFAHFEALDEALKGCDVALAQSLALGEEPLIIAGGKQVLRVERDGRLEADEVILAPLTLRLRDSQSILKGRYIKPEGGVSAPLQGSRSRIKESLAVRNRMSERVEDMP